MAMTKTTMDGPRWSHVILMILVFLQRMISDQTLAFSPSESRRRTLVETRRNCDLCPCSTTTALAIAMDPTATTFLHDLIISPAALEPFLSGSENPDAVEVAKIAVPLLLAAAFGAATRAASSQLVSKSVLDSIVAGTYLERRKDSLERVYKASIDGWSAIAFHEAVDGMGSGVVVARGINGATFGGFNPNGWRSTDDYYSSSAAFLWFLKGSGVVVKLPVLAGGNCAVFDYATSGPCFGAADLVIGPPQAAVMGGFAGPNAEDIGKSAGSLRQCRSAVGSTYDSNPAWPARGGLRLVEVEVYCVAALP